MGVPYPLHDQARRHRGWNVVGAAGQIAPGGDAILHHRVVAVEGRAERQPGVLQREGARQMLFVIKAYAPDQLAVIELLRDVAEQHAGADPHQQGQLTCQAVLRQGIQAGQQHVLVHLPKLGWRIGGSGASAQHQLVGDQAGGGVEQRIERQETLPQDFLANRVAAGDAQHLRHHHGLIGFAGIDAAADYAGWMEVVCAHDSHCKMGSAILAPRTIFRVHRASCPLPQNAKETT